MTNNAGGVDSTDPLERLSPLPSSWQPLLVELGVLKGGDRVLFVVQPGTIVTGPGTCTPGPIDCQVLSLAPDETEQLATLGTSVALFSVTGIKIEHYPTAVAADKARRAASPAGRSIVASSTLTAVSLFQYRPTIGAVVDLRTLSVQGAIR
jgi:hypothetical protein